MKVVHRSWRGFATAIVVLQVSACTRPAQPDKVKLREQCSFGAGARIAETADLPKALPLEHVVLLMQENRSFDHYFSELEDVRTAPPGRSKETAYCVQDVPHSWNPSHVQWNDGAMDGFVNAAGGSDPERAMRYYGESDIPYYYALARAFSISDAHHASLLSGTWPNRMFYLAGTSFGTIANEPPPTRAPDGTPYTNLFEQLEEAGIDFRLYRSDTPTLLLFLESYGRFSDRVRPVEHFYQDAANGDLPAFAMVEPFFTGFPRNDEHAPNNIQRGQAFSAGVINALMASPVWRSSALILTWDEGGGFYDSVPPPTACEPGHAVKADPKALPGTFARLGFRVGLIAVSPYAKRHHVSHATTDHASILRFVQAVFDLPALTPRDANADPLSDMFDFAHPVFETPALPEAVVDPVRDADCNARFSQR